MMEEQIKDKKTGAKVLVVYYSRSETTHKVALDIAQELGADIERITDQKDRSGFVGYMKSGKEATRKEIVDIDMPQKDPANYDLVIIGTPVWAYTMCSPVRTYLSRYGPKMATVAFFCTADGREATTIEDMTKIVGRPALATMVVYRKEVKKGTFHPKVIDFVAISKRSPTEEKTTPAPAAN